MFSTGPCIRCDVVVFPVCGMIRGSGLVNRLPSTSGVVWRGLGMKVTGVGCGCHGGPGPRRFVAATIMV